KQTLDIARLLRRARKLFSSVHRIDQLLEQFAELLREELGTDLVRIFLREKSAFVEVSTTSGLRESQTIPLDAAITQTLASLPPFSVDVARHLPPDRLITATSNQIAALGGNAATGIRTKYELDGFVLLGARLSGRIYSATELDTVQVICNQLGVAIENAKLYTAIEDSKIYNEMLLDSLASGVVAVSTDGTITVFNREAQRITGLSPQTVVGKTTEVLPKELRDALETPLKSGTRIELHDDWIERDGSRIPVRLSSSVFLDHASTPMGAFAVFTDMSLIRKLEEHIRRSDRIASLGTLAAGMAHEIKNPLVSLKTFTQLLPERYDDPEFRETFSTLIGKEVARIDELVNRLLGFARPPRATLVPLAICDVVRESLKLLEQQFKTHRITVETSFEAECDRIQGDADLLKQVFINLLLNAMEAMDDGGTISIRTTTIPPARMSPFPMRQGLNRGSVLVTISDTGRGIPKENLARIFDPFFTTKPNGTGLGLSVAYGIIQEHEATIEVESELGRGTSFHIKFPLFTSGEANNK
ncbi:MAG: ATP-binding protein, partial [Kiritimatiellae bacterium]|nr:ATP-binding protein [Kiritimatiellia bacterium]